jgi:hypothetical protein
MTESMVQVDAYIEKIQDRPPLDQQSISGEIGPESGGGEPISPNNTE